MKHILKTVLLALAILAFVLPASALAQEKINLVVGPVRQELFLDPGESDQVEIRFYNESDQPMNGVVSVVDFLVEGTSGGPKLIDDPAVASPKFSGAKWVTIPYTEMTIPAHNRVQVPVSINVPTNAAPGGRYVAVYFQPKTGAPSSSGSGIASRVASLLYIRVNGNITENAIVTRFYSPSLSEFGPVIVNTEIMNRGDYHISPKAIVAMTDVFGSLVDQVKLEDLNIFPNTSRIYETKIGPKWLFGRYKMALMASYGSTGKALDAATYVWVMPWRIIAIVILSAILLSILVKKLIMTSREHVSHLENKLEKEEAEIEELKKMLRKKND